MIIWVNGKLRKCELRNESNYEYLINNLVLDLQLEKYEIARDVILSGLQIDPFR
jgi:hypothetical protein